MSYYHRYSGGYPGAVVRCWFSIDRILLDLYSVSVVDVSLYIDWLEGVKLCINILNIF